MIKKEAKPLNEIKFFDQCKIVKSIFLRYIFSIPKSRTLLIPYVFMVIISKYFEIVALNYSTLLNKVIGGDDKGKDINNLLMYFLTSFINIFLIEFVCYIFVPPIQYSFRLTMRETFRDYISVEYQTYKNIGSGEIYNCIERKSKAVSDILEVLIIDMFPIFISVLFTCYRMSSSGVGIYFPIIMLIGFFLFFYVTVYITAKRTIIRRELLNRINDQSNTLYDTLLNYETVSAYNNQELEVRRFDNKLHVTQHYFVKLYKSLYVLNFIQKFIFLMQQAVGTLIIILTYKNDDTGNKDTFFIFHSVIKIMGFSLSKTGHLYNKYSMGIVNYSSVNQMTQREESIKVEVRQFKNNIKFENVNIYHGSKILLRDLNFTIEKSKRIAVVGCNGVGKSSLIKTLFRFIKYDGKILIDNIDLETISKESIHDLICYVQQDSGIFNDSVMHNIRYGNTKKTDDQIKDKCKEIEIHDSIKKLSYGYQTISGERGMFLSGGERQKIAFARVATKEREIIVLDEPTASLDKLAELNILKKFFEHFKNGTFIIIVHNLEILALFDCIIFLGGDNIFEYGHINDLLSKKGEFYNFYKSFNKKIC